MIGVTQSYEKSCARLNIAHPDLRKSYEKVTIGNIIYIYGIPHKDARAGRRLGEKTKFYVRMLSKGPWARGQGQDPNILIYIYIGPTVRGASHHRARIGENKCTGYDTQI